MTRTGWKVREWWKRHHVHRRARITINRYGDITRSCLDCGDILHTPGPGRTLEDMQPTATERQEQ